ncbi:MAG: glycosyltransferase family 2 protein [Lachnospiraceae bacterium]|nr:glycosyltransferase family 2 protein [Lachnospiraceae bacterium]
MIELHNNNGYKIIDVIIPNYNGGKYLEDCLASLREQTFKHFSVFVIDNASTDGSDLIVKDRFPEYNIIRLDKNYGFARAVNEGIRQSDAEYIILLNNDVIVNKKFIENLYKAIDNSNNVFSYQAKMLNMFARDRIDSAGDLYCALGWAFALGKDQSSHKYDKEATIFSSCAGAAIYRRRLFDATGYFDEKHFCYLEDVDLSFRARINGYSNRFCPDAIVYHAGSGTSGSRHNEFKVFLAARNNIYLLYKNLPPIMLFINLPLLLAGHLIKFGYFIKKGFGRAYFKGIVKGFCLCRENKRVVFKKGSFPNYLKIQKELWINTIRRITG